MIESRRLGECRRKKKMNLRKLLEIGKEQKGKKKKVSSVFFFFSLLNE